MNRRLLLEKIRKFFIRLLLRVKIFFTKQKITIVGSCNQCGSCCRNLYLYYATKQITSEKLFKHLKKIDKEFKNFHINKENDSKELSFYCDKIDENNRCTDYENRPSFCREYPTKYILRYDKRVLQGCGYSVKKSIKFEDYLNLKLNKR